MICQWREVFNPCFHNKLLSFSEQIVKSTEAPVCDLYTVTKLTRKRNKT